MNNLKTKGLFALLGGIAFMVLLISPQNVGAVNECWKCHTMHDSQAGTIVATGGPLDNLLKTNTCLGCHTGTNAAGSTPYVLDTSGAPTATSLAGGNFYWVDITGDAKGHNVTGINAIDAAFTTIPGQGTAYSITNQVTCAGIYGCHGARTTVGDMVDLAGAHHNNSFGQLTTATTKGNSYRFLSGIQGFEDSDWELATTTTNHNEYKGTARTATGDATTASISNFCAGCHGTFHTGNDIDGAAWNTPWQRHPTDYDMQPLAGEYNTFAWNTLTPVGKAAIPATPNNNTGAGETIITCISCHRAHGSPYDDLLRWDYSAGNCEEGVDDADCGCFKCHTQKDAG